MVQLKQMRFQSFQTRNLEGWPVFERNRLSAATPDARFGDNINDPMERSGS